MQNLKKFFSSIISLTLIFSVLTLTSLPQNADAYIIENSAYNSSSIDSERADIQRLIETKKVTAHLAELGYEATDISEKVALLSDAEIHTMSQNLNNINDGQGVLGVLIGLGVLAIIVLVILHMTGHKIVVE